MENCHTSARTDCGPSIVIIAVNGCTDVTLMHSTTEAIASQTVYCYWSTSCVENRRSIADHRRGHTARIYNDTVVVVVVVLVVVAPVVCGVVTVLTKVVLRSRCSSYIKYIGSSCVLKITVAL